MEVISELDRLEADLARALSIEPQQQTTRHRIKTIMRGTLEETFGLHPGEER